MPKYSSNVTIMMQAVRKASRSLIRDFGEVENLQVSKKGPGDFVSAADIRAEEILFEELNNARPDYGFLLEESGKVKGKDSEYRWIVDPLDGTANYLHGFPYFCVSVALEKKLDEGRYEIVASVIEAPAQQEIFWAERGKGAWLENSSFSSVNRLRVAARNKLGESMLCVGSLKRDQEVINDLFITNVGKIRAMGSTALALAYVAAGRYDCFFQQDPHLWDVAAGSLIIKEAGGMVCDQKAKFNIKDAEYIIAGNYSLQKQIFSLFR